MSIAVAVIAWKMQARNRQQEKGNKDQVVQMAKHLFAANPDLINQCYEAYKDNLDDPSSLQVSIPAMYPSMYGPKI